MDEDFPGEMNDPFQHWGWGCLLYVGLFVGSWALVALIVWRLGVVLNWVGTFY